MNVYRLPVLRPFLRDLAQGLLARYAAHPEELADVHVLLPTRRAVRLITDIFLDLTDGAPLLLPHLRAVADVDDQELELLLASAGHDVTAFPPALSGSERHLILTQMVQARDKTAGYARAADLARTLAEFLDQMADEGLSFEALTRAVPAEFAAHWQLTLDFLQILREVWPAYLQSQGSIEGAARRGVLLRALAAHWQENPPAYPVIMAGVSGSLPAAAELMRVVASLPVGAIILAGHDPALDYTAITDPQHPAYERARLLDFLGVASGSVAVWPLAPVLQDDEQGRARSWFLRSVMQDGTSGPDLAATVLPHIRVIECQNERHEAAVIATTARLILDEPQATLAIISPDRRLAREIMSACAGVGLAVNDSGGDEIGRTRAVAFLELLWRVPQAGFHPVDILSLVQHPLCHLDGFGARDIAVLDLCLRGPRPAPSLDGVLAHLRGSEKLAPTAMTAVAEFLTALDQFYHAAVDGGAQDFCDFLAAHLRLAETWAARTDDGISMLWQGDEGLTLGQVFTPMLDQRAVGIVLDGGDYWPALMGAMAGVRVNRRHVGHPRLALLGVYESRLIEASHVIVAGMNEGVWPPPLPPSPWLSRKMRTDIGLPPDTVRIGRMAADWQQLMLAPQVVLTRSRRMGGVVATPSRWLARLDNFLRAQGTSPRDIRDHNLTAWTAQRLAPRALAQTQCAVRPAPRPPVHLRPRQISATQIEMLMRNPYGFYARQILRLSRLDPYDAPINGAVRGIVLHKVLEQFVSQQAANLPQNPMDELQTILHETLRQKIPDPAMQAVVRPRLMRALENYWHQEINWRAGGYHPVAFEQTHAMTMAVAGENYTLTAKMDRIDRGPTGGGVVIDYKTGGALPTLPQMMSGYAPQIPVEVLLLDEPVEAAVIWQVSATTMPVLKSFTPQDVADMRALARAGLVGLLTVFADPQTPYYPVPDPARVADYDDYAHLARYDLWYGQDDDGGTA